MCMPAAWLSPARHRFKRRAKGEVNATGQYLVRYVPGPGIDQRETMIVTDPATGAALMRRYYHANRLGSVIALSNQQSGVLTDQYVYTPYGVEALLATSGNPFRYTGRRFDAESGLYYYRARYYWPQIGRFLETDPIGYADQLNLYAYVGNSPLMATDPTGKCPWCIGAAIGAVVGGGLELGRQYLSGEDVNLARVGIAALGGALAGGTGGALVWAAAEVGGATTLAGATGIVGGNALLQPAIAVTTQVAMNVEHNATLADGEARVDINDGTTEAAVVALALSPLGSAGDIVSDGVGALSRAAAASRAANDIVVDTISPSATSPIVDTLTQMSVQGAAQSTVERDPD
jgi:RHS repeat-associated protein